MINEYTQKLIKLYSNKSKHSNYQVLPGALRKILEPDQVQTRTRFEKERLDYLKNKLDFNNKSILDIGANTGFFTFEALDLGAAHVDYCEGNKEHAEFVQTAVDALGVDDKIKVINQYFDFDQLPEKRYDIVLLFNVLHHIGDDYGDKNLSISRAKVLIAQHLNNMAKITNTLVFQLGFNWQGKTERPLFDDGTKKELIYFVTNGVKDYWQIQHIGIATGAKESARYVDLNDDNIVRDDTLGEFLNRPIFILKAKD